MSSRSVLTDHAEYAAARADVDTLSGRGFPVEHLAIVGTELYLQEQLAGPRGAVRRSARWAVLGAVAGAVLAVLAASADSPSVAGVLGCAFGALLGGLAAAAPGRAQGRGCRVAAGRHQVLVSHAWADDARLLLNRTSVAARD